MFIFIENEKNEFQNYYVPVFIFYRMKAIFHIFDIYFLKIYSIPVAIIRAINIKITLVSKKKKRAEKT